MIPEIPPSTTGSSKRRFSRARKRQALIGTALGALLAVTAVVIIVSTSGGSRSGTLASGATGIDSFDPTNGLVNDEVHIVGAGFTGATDVRFNGVSVTSFNVISDTEIATLVPDGALTGPITVSTPDGDLVSTDDFTCGQPTIRDFSPTSAASGATITINGTNLDGVTTVKFNGLETPALNATSTSVQAVVPANASTGLVSVVTGTTRASSDTALTITSPSIDHFDPQFGAPGTQVTLTGANLAGITAVQFNGAAGQVVSTSPDGTSAVVSPPASFTEGPITVSTSGGELVTDLPFGTGPVITSISPTTAPVGSTLTITGKYLTNTVSVSFVGTNGTSAPFTVVSDTQVTATVPDTAVTGPITVVAGGATTSGASVTIPGVIQSFSPDAGLSGTTVTIYGTGLSGATAVRFNGLASGMVKLLSDTKITAAVPSGASTGVITVVTPTATLTSTDSYRVMTVQSVTPSYDWSPPVGVPYVPDPAAPVGGTDFSKSTTVKISGITFTAITSATASTSSTTTTVVKAGASAALTTTATTTTVAGTTTTVAGGTTTSSAASSTPTTTVAQVPFTGTATVAIGRATTFTAKVTYTDPSNWSITPSTSSQSLSFSVAGKTMNVSSLSGAIAASGGNILWGLSGTGALTTLIANKFALNAGSLVYFTGTCPTSFSTVLCSTGAGPFARIDGNSTTSGMTAVVGNIIPNQTALAYQAAVDLKSNVFDLDGTYTSDSVATIREGHLRMAFKDSVWAKTDTDVVIESGTVNNGLDIIVTGKSHVDVPYIGGFNPPSITVWYVDGGSMLSFHFPIKRVVGEASMGSATFLTGHGSPLQATVAGQARQLTDSAWVFIGSMRMPSYMQRAFKVDSGEVLAIATMTGNGYTEVRASFRTPIDLPKIPYVNATFDGFSAGVRFDESNENLTAQIFAEADGSVSIDGNAPFAVSLELAFNKAKQFSWTITLTASGEDGRSLWPDMFGVEDFNLEKFSIKGTFIGLAWDGIGLAGNGTLPGKLMEYMGASDGVSQPISFVVDLSTVSPCLQVAAGTPDNQDALFAFPPDTQVLSINYFRVSVSAMGCTVGAFDVPSGVVVAEKGTFYGVKKDFMIAYNPKKTGPPKSVKSPSFYGWDSSQVSIDKGAIGFKYKFSWGVGGWNPFPYFFIDGSLKLGSNAAVVIHGGCVMVVGIPTCSAEGEGDINLGKGLSARMKLKADGIGTPLTTFLGSGDVNIFGLKFGLTGSFTSTLGAPLGWDFSATADLPGKSNLIDKLGVRIGFGLRKNICVLGGGGSGNTISDPGVGSGSIGGSSSSTTTTTVAAGTSSWGSGSTSSGTCKQWSLDPLFALTIEGNTGGLMKVINGAADAFGQPPVADGGRYALRAKWSPEMTSIGFGGSSTISLGSLGAVDAGLHFAMCLTSDCLGHIDAGFQFDYRTHKRTFSFDVPMKDNWSFNYSKTATASYSESGQVGDKYLGLKGTISGSVSIGLRVSYPPVAVAVPLTFDLSANASVGFGGWSSIGSVDVYDDGSKFCFQYKIGRDTYHVCA